MADPGTALTQGFLAGLEFGKNFQETRKLVEEREQRKQFDEVMPQVLGELKAAAAPMLLAQQEIAALDEAELRGETVTPEQRARAEAILFKRAAATHTAVQTALSAVLMRYGSNPFIQKTITEVLVAHQAAAENFSRAAAAGLNFETAVFEHGEMGARQKEQIAATRSLENLQTAGQLAVVRETHELAMKRLERGAELKATAVFDETTGEFTTKARQRIDEARTNAIEDVKAAEGAVDNFYDELRRTIPGGFVLDEKGQEIPNPQVPQTFLYNLAVSSKFVERVRNSLGDAAAARVQTGETAIGEFERLTEAVAQKPSPPPAGPGPEAPSPLTAPEQRGVQTGAVVRRLAGPEAWAATGRGLSRAFGPLAVSPRSVAEFVEGIIQGVQVKPGTRPAPEEE